MPLAQRLYALQRRVEGVASPSWQGYRYWTREGGLNLYQAPPAEADALPAADAALAVLAAGATLASNVGTAPRPRREDGKPRRGGAAKEQLHLRTVQKVVGAVIEMSMNHSRQDARAPETITPQQVTELWQPLAVELHRDTVLCLISLLVALLTGQQAKRELVSAVCAMRLLTVHFLLAERCNLDFATVMQPPPPAAGGAPQQAATAEGAALRSQLLDRLILVLDVGAADLAAARVPGRAAAEAICVIVAGAKAFFPEPHQPVALLHACVMKQKAAAPAGDRARPVARTPAPSPSDARADGVDRREAARLVAHRAGGRRDAPRRAPQPSRRARRAAAARRRG